MTAKFKVPPYDVHNQALVANVHPLDWQNPEPATRYNLVVIGAGAAGLITAAIGAGLGARVALVERDFLGGDCLNVGCVPSKALILAARAAADVRDARRFGIEVPPGTRVNFSAVMERMRRLRAAISPKDSAERYRDLGVDVFLGSARFSGPKTVDVDGKTLRFRKAVIATGARARTPEIPGIAEAGYLTNETVFRLTELPRRLAVLGAGPLGCELAQAFARFGAQVTLLANHPHIMPREDRDASAIVQAALIRDGVQLLLSCDVLRVETRGSEKVIYLKEAAQPPLVVDEILVGIGRAPNVEGLNLETVGVNHDPQRGVTVDDCLRTTNPRIYAAGDICSPYKFTHAADAMARLVIQNSLFPGRGRLSALTIPWCTYTDPEVAHVGLSEADARAQGINITTFLQPLHDVDRAILDDESDGFVKIHVRAGTDKILGATIVARHAGEMISEITLAMVGGLGLSTLSKTIHPYPTQAEAIKKAADAYQRTKLTAFVKGLFEKWLRWQRW